MKPIAFLPLLSLASASATAPARQLQNPLLGDSLPKMPFSYSKDEPTIQPAVRLNDILPTHRSLTTFSSLTRQSAAVDALLSSSSHKTTVLAPLNSAVEALPRKPWEDLGEYDEGGAEVYEGEEGRERAAKNLRRFVEAHLVGTAPWKEGEKVRTVTDEGQGREVWWETREGKRVVLPDEVEVERVASRVGNGELVSIFPRVACVVDVLTVW